MKMHNPPHPGEVLRELCFESLGLTVTAAANALGVSRKTLSSILNCRAGISPAMAALRHHCRKLAQPEDPVRSGEG